MAVPVTTTTIPLVSVARGSIVAPGGVPQIVKDCGLEIFSAGSNWWTARCWDHVRGVMEFDLRALPPGLSRRVVLVLQDSGASGTGQPQTTNVLGYAADGVRTVEDWDRPANLVLTVTRPNVAGTTTHEVTEFVNASRAAGNRFVGFRMEPVDSSTYDAFGFSGLLIFE
jgi:hypothetical protein